MDKILIIAAHPDDDILGCGGLLAKYEGEKKFRIVFLAEGSSCRFSDLDVQRKAVDCEINERNNYAIEALGLLGVNDVEFYNLPCGRLDAVPIIELNKIIENEIKEFNPRILMTHSDSDVNNDHKIVFNSTMMATRPAAFINLERVISFEIQSSSEWNFLKPFQPNQFEVLSEAQVEMKWKSLLCYKSEIRGYPHPRSYEGVLSLARYRGMQCGFSYAEAFRVIRSTKI